MEPARFGQEKPLPRKKGPSGCVIILLVFLGLFVLVGALIAVGVYQLLDDPQVKEAVSAMGSMVAAEGRAELEAAGCDAAMVIDMRAFATLAKNSQGNRPEDIEALEKSVFINCVLMQPKPGLTCEMMAQVYRAAIATTGKQPPPELSVFIQAQGQPEPVCTGRYDATGTFLGEAVPPPNAGPRPLFAPGQMPPIDPMPIQPTP